MFVHVMSPHLDSLVQVQKLWNFNRIFENNISRGLAKCGLRPPKLQAKIRFIEGFLEGLPKITTTHDIMTYIVIK